MTRAKKVLVPAGQKKADLQRKEIRLQLATNGKRIGQEAFTTEMATLEEDELREIPDRLEQKVRAEMNLREAQR